MTGVSGTSGITCASCGQLNPFGMLVCFHCGGQLDMLVVEPASDGFDPVPAMFDLGPAAAGWAPVPGPADRESFFDAQRRHRRATWRLAVACALAAVITGIPMSIALTPVIYAFAVVSTWLIDLVAPVPQQVWDAYLWSGSVLLEVVDSMDDPATPGVSEGDIGRIPLDLLLYSALIWFVPGMLFMLVCWGGLRSLFRHGGPGGVLLTLGAREPRAGDFEERQLVNVVEEIAIAAGLPAPKVMLLDSAVANAAVVGSSRDNAIIVVSRALLDDLDRDATQGVLANLVASIGNGDLRGARSIIAVFETFGFASVLLKAPVSRPARRMLWRIVRYAFGRHTPEQRASEAHAVAGMLTQSFWDTDEEDDLSFLNDGASAPAERRGPSVMLLFWFPPLAIGMFVVMLLAGFPMFLIKVAIGGLFFLAVLLVWYQRRFVLYMLRHAIKTARAIMVLPYYLGTMMPQIALMIIIPFMLEPMIALLWRRRRYLADASAVQITRNPDGIAGGLVGLVARGGLIPGGHWASPMFVVGPEATQAREMNRFQELQRRRIEERRRLQNPDGGGLIGELRAMAATSAESGVEMMRHHGAGDGDESLVPPGARDSMLEGSFSGSSGSIISFHPPLNRRLRKLRRMGSSVGDVEMYRRSMRSMYSTSASVLVTIAVIPLMLLAAVLMVVALVLMMGLALLFCGILMMLVYGLAVVLAP